MVGIYITGHFVVDCMNITFLYSYIVHLFIRLLIRVFSGYTSCNLLNARYFLLVCYLCVKVLYEIGEVFHGIVEVFYKVPFIYYLHLLQICLRQINEL